MNETLLSAPELEAVRRKFKSALERRDVIRLVALFGYSRTKARSLIEGTSPALKPLPAQPLGKRKRWAREVIITALNFSISA